MSSFGQMLTDAVGDLPFDEAQVEEFETAAFALLATALAKLPKVRRQALLHDIETGSLREAVRKFPDTGSLGDPKGPYEHLN